MSANLQISLQRLILVFVLFSGIVGCHDNTILQVVHENKIKQKLPKEFKPISVIEKEFIDSGLVNIHELDTTIKVQLAYASVDNFLHTDLYKGLNKCYLPLEVAQKLVHAQQYLKQASPYYNLIVFDATRPLHIQRYMWDSLKVDVKIKSHYLAYPADISLHNYGAAVDLGLISDDAVIADMGTPFDFFGPEAHTEAEQQLVDSLKITKEQLYNRLLLRRVMQKAGFSTIRTEWWHFNECGKKEAEVKFKLIQ